MNQIFTSQAPHPIGPYSQAVISGKLVYCSGQIALNPQTGQLVGHDIREQTRQVLSNLQAVLTGSRSSVDHALKVTVFLTNLDDFAVFNEEYARIFSSSAPARTTVQVTALPKGALVEIDLIAEIL
jgi:2-iminobutanoate/2-iminopropanoate deaminase